MPQPTPSRIHVRMYQVGFGDCFLLSFEYPRALSDDRMERHVLIDFGTTRRHPKWDHEDIAKLLVEHTGGRLDAIVVSHRHQDHLSGFGNVEAAQVIASLKPQVVVRPWTEDPKAAADATSSRGRFIKGLASAQQFAAAFEQHVPTSARGLRGDLRELAIQQLANQKAVTQLDQLAAGNKGRYVSIGQPSGLEELLPGVSVTVLGPPTIDQWPDVMGRRERDPEYWMLLGRQLASGKLNLVDELMDDEVDEEVAATSPTKVEPGPTRWLVDHMQRQQLFVVQRIVESMDQALNNTSVILLFEVGGRRLLFSGDAQIENWEYLLDQYLLDEHEDRDALLKKLDQVDLYKVGHHGSRNATPKSGLYGRWAKAHNGRSMTSLLSTKTGVHGKSEATKVPRATLVNALRKLGELHTTQDFSAAQGFVHVSADVAGTTPFEVSQ